LSRSAVQLSRLLVGEQPGPDQLAETDTGADDVELAEWLTSRLPWSDPRHATITARAERFRNHP
jgi:hypothetical protein